jgi:hypothetical protein
LRNVPMTRKLRFAEARLAETSVGCRGIPQDRLPVGAAMTAVAGANLALWSLIAIAVRSLL